MVSLLRERNPDVAVGDVYDHPTVGSIADHLDALDAGTDHATDRSVRPTPLKTQTGQVVAVVLLRALAAPRWVVWLSAASTVVHDLYDVAWLPTASWWWLVVGALVFVTPPGRMLLAAGGARFLLRDLEPGEHPRGGKTHLRLWAAERLVDQLGATSLAGAPYMTWYARLLGAKVGRHADLHSVPPVTGNLTLGKGCSVEPEVDLTGYWVDGDVLRVGEIRVGHRARVGTRSMLCPDAVVGDDAEVAAGSAVFGTVPAGEFWSGSPATRLSGAARGPWSERPTSSPAWVAAYAVVATVLSLLPALSVAAGGAVALAAADLSHVSSAGDLLGALLPWLVPATLVGLLVLTALVLLVVRVAARGLTAGVYPVRSRIALQVWATVRVLDEARTWLFPLYSSQLTPTWLRLLGARIGADVEASTVLMIPAMTTVNDLAFLADDTLIGGYELGGGWLRIERVKIGKRSFVGNSGMAAPGRKVPKRALVAVLSAAPGRKTARAGESWLGSPPATLRRTSQSGDDGRTYAPPTRLKVARGLWETARLVPVVASVGMYAAVGRSASLPRLPARSGWRCQVWAWRCSWPVLPRRLPRPRRSGCWSAGSGPAPTRCGAPSSGATSWPDTFIEVLAAPFFARVTVPPAADHVVPHDGDPGRPGRVGETYWLPEADLVTLGDGATVNQGSVLQTHLFHDRMLATDTVQLRRGATLGPNSVILPAATIGRHATVGPVSLVMRGESVPDKTGWIGNPIGPWVDQ